MARVFLKILSPFLVQPILLNCMMNKTLFSVIVLVSLISCKNLKKKTPNSGAFAKMEMMEADRDFSKMSEEKGMKAAFIENLDSNGILLRPNHLPIAGADAIDYLIQQNDSDYTLTWEPRNGAIARSGELGYTYGIYALRPSKKDTVIYGTYVSIWKKERDGTWKYVLDSGNEGIGDIRNEQ
jgi:ketosteroid isomerase-like protein